MSLKRTKFSTIGTHCLLGLIRNHLIYQGYQMVSSTDNPDFFVIGSEYKEGGTLPLAQLDLQLMTIIDTPALVLSSSKVYSTIDTNGMPIKKGIMKESSGLCIPKQCDFEFNEPLYSIISENHFMNRDAPTVVIRPFNIYGPSLKSVITTFIYQAKRDIPFSIYGTGYQSRTFLYESDFLDGTRLLINELMQGSGGIYNIGSLNSLSILQLAKTIYGFINNSKELNINYQYKHMFMQQWKYPCIEPLKALGWYPTVSVRKGIFRCLND